MWIFKIKVVKKLMQKLQKLIQIGGYSRDYYRNESVLDKLFLLYGNKPSSSSLDIGSGPEPKNPFNTNILYGVDFRANKEKNVVYSDLSLGQLPFENEKFDFLTAFDVLEHIPRVIWIDGKTIFPLVVLMNEIFRVLRPGGVLFTIQPVYPAKSVFQDPTHINIMSEDTMDYYFCSKAWARIYGYEGSFVMIRDGWIGEKYFCFMEKSSDTAIKDLNFIQE